SGRVVFGDADSALDGFLKDRGLRRSDLWFDKAIAFGGRGSSGGRVVLAGRNLAFITDSYVFIELPVKARADVKDGRGGDLTGAGRQAVVVRYVERAGGGSRDVLSAYRVAGDSVHRVFAAEVAKATGAGHIEDKVGFVKRGRATDIVIDAGSADGLS